MPRRPVPGRAGSSSGGQPERPNDDGESYRGQFLGIVAVPASATVCVNVSKPDDAGNIGDVIIRLDGGVTEARNAGGQLAGGFVDIYVEFDVDADGAADGMIKILDDTYILDIKHAMAAGLPLPELPEGAHLAAGCGVAVDDAIVCSIP